MENRLKVGHIAVHTLDLNFMGLPGTIAAYLIPYEHGAVLVESGPGSTIPALQAGLRAYGFTEADISDVLLTHIHLDHAGAAGWLARQGARIHVHPAGAPHLLDPEKLLASARRIYGDMMAPLWGEFLPVPTGKLSVLSDAVVVEIDHLRFQAIDTPGHANHHFVYLFQDICFTGDIGGIRLAGRRHLRLPMPPPEFHLELWRESLARLHLLFKTQPELTRIAPTHFGIYPDPDWHLAEIGKALDEIEAWMTTIMPTDPPIEALNEQFMEWTRNRSLAQGLEADLLGAYETANPSWMSSHGIHRYWRKHRQEKSGLEVGN